MTTKKHIAGTQLIAVYSYASSTGFVIGERFDNVTPSVVLDFVTDTWSEHAVWCEFTDDGILYYALGPIDEQAPAPETAPAPVVSAHAPAPVVSAPEPAAPVAPVVSRFPLRANDKPWRMEDAELASVYGLERTGRKCMVSVFVEGVEPAKDAERIAYRHIETRAYYAQYHGEFWAVPESGLMPEERPVTVKQITPEPKAPKAKAPKAKTLKYAAWVEGEKIIVRRVHFNDYDEKYVTHNGQKLVADLPDPFVSTKARVDKWAKETRANMRKAQKLTAKAPKVETAPAPAPAPETAPAPAPVDLVALVAALNAAGYSVVKNA